MTHRGNHRGDSRLNVYFGPMPEVIYNTAVYFSNTYSKRQIYLPFTIAASGGCERARKEISRFAARARRGVNVQNEIRFDYLSEHIQASASELAQVLELSPVRTRAILKKMVDGGIVVIEGGNRNRIYKLK